MQKFYLNAFLVGVAAMVLSIAAVYFTYIFSAINLPLMPASESAYPWGITEVTDVSDGGNSTLNAIQSDNDIAVDFQLNDHTRFPYAALFLAFADQRYPEQLVDLSRFNSIRFDIACAPRNVLTFFLYSFDDALTNPGDFSSYLPSTFFFSCEQDWETVTIDLKKLIVADWWLNRQHLDYSYQQYQLEKVLSVAIYNSRQTPINTPLHFEMAKVELIGRAMHYVYFVCCLIGLLWLVAAFVFFKCHTQQVFLRLKEKLEQDQPLKAYQKISLENKADNDKTALMNYLATSYSNPNLNLETAINAQGLSRIRINEILKEETGLTFITYINKVRLTEAARLLLEANTTIAEVAYSVGYSNPSYFNKLFKSEYGCTPKSFRQHMSATSPA